MKGQLHGCENIGAAALFCIIGLQCLLTLRILNVSFDAE